uniref:Translation initiation factor 5A C-terminal domain-containing protein n=1 Tax=Cyprinodon variegatus TaxID=28743 RepID=A0A3Q2D7I5_CYPVA
MFPLLGGKLQLIDVNDGFLSLMLLSGEIKDLKIPDGDLGREMVKKFHEGEEIMVSVLKAVGEEHAVDFKIITK